MCTIVLYTYLTQTHNHASEWKPTCCKMYLALDCQMHGYTLHTSKWFQPSDINRCFISDGISMLFWCPSWTSKMMVNWCTNGTHHLSCEHNVSTNLQLSENRQVCSILCNIIQSLFYFIPVCVSFMYLGIV